MARGLEIMLATLFGVGAIVGSVRAETPNYVQIGSTLTEKDCRRVLYSLFIDVAEDLRHAARVRCFEEVSAKYGFYNVFINRVFHDMSHERFGKDPYELNFNDLCDLILDEKSRERRDLCQAESIAKNVALRIREPDAKDTFCFTMSPTWDDNIRDVNSPPGFRFLIKRRIMPREEIVYDLEMIKEGIDKKGDGCVNQVNIVYDSKFRVPLEIKKIMAQAEFKQELRDIEAETGRNPLRKPEPAQVEETPTEITTQQGTLGEIYPGYVQQQFYSLGEQVYGLVFYGETLDVRLDAYTMRIPFARALTQNMNSDPQINRKLYQEMISRLDAENAFFTFLFLKPYIETSRGGIPKMGAGDIKLKVGDSERKVDAYLPDWREVWPFHGKDFYKFVVGDKPLRGTRDLEIPFLVGVKGINPENNIRKYIIETGERNPVLQVLDDNGRGFQFNLYDVSEMPCP